MTTPFTLKIYSDFLDTPVGGLCNQKTGDADIKSGSLTISGLSYKLEDTKDMQQRKQDEKEKSKSISNAETVMSNSKSMTFVIVPFKDAFGVEFRYWKRVS